MHLPLPLANVAAAGVAPWLIAPFGLLLLLIAAMPLTPHRIKQVWEKYYPHIALGLWLFIAVWYVVMMPHGTAVVRHTVLEYISFIALIGSLFVVAGGIHLKVKGSATPWENLRLLAIGAVVANLVGTTGASMVLIRPWLRMNQGRIRPYHVVFFIFIVSNCGGALTPIGDPPLFLGYLRGVPFFWLIGNVAGFWAMVVGSLLAVFWWLDRREFKKQPAAMQPRSGHRGGVHPGEDSTFARGRDDRGGGDQPSFHEQGGARRERVFLRSDQGSGVFVFGNFSHDDAGARLHRRTRR